MCHNDCQQDASCFGIGFPSNMESSANESNEKSQKSQGFSVRMNRSTRSIKAALLLIQLCIGVFFSSLPSFAETGCEPGQDYQLDFGNRLIFTIKKFGNYENIEGRMCNLPEEATLMSARVNEQLGNADGVVSSNEKESVKNVTNVSGLLAHTLKTLEYGAWYFSESDNRFLFQPNSEKINTIGSEEHVVSRLEIGTVSPANDEFQMLSSVSVIIEGADPVISVTPDSDETAEGGKAMFKLFANRDSRTERTVELSVNYDGGEFQKRFLRSLTLPAEESCRIVSVNIPEAGAHLNVEAISPNAAELESEDNQIKDVFEEELFDTVVSIKLAVESGERYDRAEVNGDATVGIPVGSLSSSSIVPGTEFRDDFSVSECDESNTPVIAVASGALAVAAAALTTVAVVASGSDSSKADGGNGPATDDKPDDTPPVVMPDTTPDTTPDEGSPELPMVSVKNERSFVREDSQLRDTENLFYLEISEMLEHDVVVNLQIDLTGNYIAGEIPQTMTISSRTLRKYFRFEIENDDIDEEDGKISVTVAEGEEYRASTEPHKVTASMEVIDDDIPEVSFSDDSQSRGPISESESITYNLSTDIAPWMDLTVILTVSGIEGDFVDPDQNKISAMIEAGKTKGKVKISPHDDNVDEAAEGRIRVRLLPDENSDEKKYKLNKDPAKTVVEFNVTDDDVPELSIRPITETVVVGKPVEFEVSANCDRSLDIWVELEYEFKEKDLFEENKLPNVLVTLPKGTADVVLPISISTGIHPVGRDPKTLKNGSVTATIVMIDLNEYNISKDMGSATVSVLKEVPSGETGITSVQIPKVQHHQPIVMDPIESIENIEIENPIPKIKVVSGGDIAEGKTAKFRIESDLVVESRLSINVFWTVEGDYLTPGSDELEIMAGETTNTLELSTNSNSKPEPDGRVEVTISYGNGYHVHPSYRSASVVILNDDIESDSDRIYAVHRTILPSLLSESSGKLVESVSSRIESAFTHSGQPEFELDGVRSMEGMASLAGRILNSDDQNLKKYLMNSRFSVPLFPEESGNATTIWGRGLNSSISEVGVGEQLAWDGESKIGNFGFDTQLGKDLLFGMAISSTEDNVEFKNRKNENAGDGLYSYKLTDLQPYWAWTNADRSTLIQGSIGFGFGAIGIEIDQGNPVIFESNRILGSLSARSLLYSSGSQLGGNLNELTLSTEAWMASQSSNNGDEGLVGDAATARNFRIELEGYRRISLQGGSVLHPTASLGIQKEDDGAGTAPGFELTGSTKYESPFGIGIAGYGSMHVAEDRGRISGLMSELNYDRGSDGVGMFINLSPAWGILNESGEKQLHDRNFSEIGILSHSDNDGLRLEAEIGYGLQILDALALVSPSVNFKLYEGGQNTFRTDYEVIVDSGMGFEFKSAYESHEGGTIDLKLRLNGHLEW